MDPKSADRFSRMSVEEQNSFIVFCKLMRDLCPNCNVIWVL